jgi:hypothetical protein
VFENYKESARRRWYKDAANGLAWYVWIRGVLWWGVPMFITMTLVLGPLLQPSPDSYSYPKLLIGAVCWLLGGVVFGWFLWLWNKRRYGLTTPPQGNDDLGEGDKPRL